MCVLTPLLPLSGPSAILHQLGANTSPCSMAKGRATHATRVISRRSYHWKVKRPHPFQAFRLLHFRSQLLLLQFLLYLRYLLDHVGASIRLQRYLRQTFRCLYLRPRRIKLLLMGANAPSAAAKQRLFQFKSEEKCANYPVCTGARKRPKGQRRLEYCSLCLTNAACKENGCYNHVPTGGKVPGKKLT